MGSPSPGQAAASSCSAGGSGGARLDIRHADLLALMPKLVPGIDLREAQAGRERRRRREREAAARAAQKEEQLETRRLQKEAERSAKKRAKKEEGEAKKELKVRLRPRSPPPPPSPAPPTPSRATSHRCWPAGAPLPAQPTLLAARCGLRAQRGEAARVARGVRRRPCTALTPLALARAPQLAACLQPLAAHTPPLAPCRRCCRRSGARARGA